MRCRRCRGLMVVDHFVDLADDQGGLWLRAWRCVNCGDVIEPSLRPAPTASLKPSWLGRRRRSAARSDIVLLGV